MKSVRSTRPTGITADRVKRQVIIDWDDNHQSRFSFDGLRMVCPCVECRGGHANMGEPPDPAKVRNATPTELSLEQIVAIGSYAIQIYWSDGHSTGIYTWDYLRAACPCDECFAINGSVE